MGLASCGATVTLSHHVQGRCVGGLRVTLLTSYCRRWLILKSAITLLRLYVTTICVMDYIWIVIWTWVTSSRLRETLSQWRSVNGVSSYSRRLWKLTPWCGLWKLTPWCMWTVKTDPMMWTVKTDPMMWTVKTDPMMYVDCENWPHDVDCENWPHDVCGLWKLTPWCMWTVKTDPMMWTVKTDPVMWTVKTDPVMRTGFACCRQVYCHLGHWWSPGNNGDHYGGKYVSLSTRMHAQMQHHNDSARA